MNLKKNILIFFCLFLFSGSSLQADEGRVEKYILENGLTVLLKEIPGSPSAAIDVLVKTGSASEGKYLGRGLSHFVEHMLFKGTDKRGVGQISKEIKSLGGIINASTGFDKTFFTIELPSDQFLKALDVMADMMMNPKFDPVEVEKEREVILNEMRLYEDNPDRRHSELIFKTMYLRHPYRHPVIGYKPLFASATRDDLLDYYHTHYVPNNMILSIAGNIRIDEVLSQIKGAFKDFKPQPYLTRDLSPEPDQLTPRTAYEEFPTELTRLSLLYPGVSITDEDMFVLDVLAMILGQGGSSRLYQDILKQKNLVSSISTENFTPIDRGAFEVSCVLKDENVDKTIQAIKAQLNELKIRGVKKEEFEKIKRQIVSRYIFDRQTSSDIAYDLMIGEGFMGDYDFSKKYVQAIQSLSMDDLTKAANKYFVDDRLNIVILRPKKNVQPPESEFEVKTPEIKKITLENGLRILLREDHKFPIVAMGVVLRGGLWQEPKEENGIFNLLGRLWTEGTKTRSSKQISQLIESCGGSLQGFSSSITFGLGLQLLSQDVDLGLSLLEDLIKNPAFPTDELAKMKDQVKNEIVQRHDNVLAMTQRAFLGTFYQEHPFRWDPLGSVESIDRIQSENIKALYEKFVSPKNMVLYVFGDINSKNVLKTITNRMGILKGGDVAIISKSEMPPQEPRFQTLTMDKQQTILMVGFPSPSFQEADYPAMQVLTSILGASMNGRLFLKIRDELGQAYRLGANSWTGIDTGFVYFYVATTEEQVEKVKEIIFREIKELQLNLLSDQDLTDTKTYMNGTYRMGLETNARLGDVTSVQEVNGLGFKYYQQYPDLIDRVTTRDIQRVAQTYLDPQKSVVIVTLPVKKENY